MYQSHEKPSRRAEKFMKEKHQHPSFSASLLEKIYRSIDESEANTDDLKFKKQGKSSGRSNKVTADPQMWHISPEQGKTSKSHRDNSWDSNSLRFSSSDTESMFGVRRHTFTPPPLPRPKAVRTSVSARLEKTEEKQRTVSYDYEQRSRTEEKQSSLTYGQNSRTEERQSTLPYEQRRPFDHYSPNPPSSEEFQEEGIAKSKSRAFKIYCSLKQPISPGGRFVSFINSLFTPTKLKKTKNSPSIESLDHMNSNAERNPKSEKSSTCPSPCSFSTSCLSKTSPERQQKPQNGGNRSAVRFHATSNAVVGEEQMSCPIKAMYGQGSSVSDAIRPPISKIVSGGLSYPHAFDVRKRHVKSRRRIEAAGGELFRDYDDEDDGDGDDASSCSSSDLFELDGLTVLASDSRYSKELPVYETTRFELGRNIGYLANGFIF